MPTALPHTADLNALRLRANDGHTEVVLDAARLRALAPKCLLLTPEDNDVDVMASQPDAPPMLLQHASPNALHALARTVGHAPAAPLSLTEAEVLDCLVLAHCYDVPPLHTQALHALRTLPLEQGLPLYREILRHADLPVEMTRQVVAEMPHNWLRRGAVEMAFQPPSTASDRVLLALTAEGLLATDCSVHSGPWVAQLLPSLRTLPFVDYSKLTGTRVNASLLACAIAANRPAWARALLAKSEGPHYMWDHWWVEGMVGEGLRANAGGNILHLALRVPGPAMTRMVLEQGVWVGVSENRALHARHYARFLAADELTLAVDSGEVEKVALIMAHQGGSVAESRKVAIRHAYGTGQAALAKPIMATFGWEDRMAMRLRGRLSKHYQFEGIR